MTILAVGASFVTVKERYRETTLEDKGGGVVFPDVARRHADIATIEVARANGSFTLERKESQWLNMGLGGYPATTSRVERLVQGLGDLRYVEPKTARAHLYGALEVENVAPGAKSTRITLMSKSNERLADIVVGKVKERLPNTNGRAVDGPGVYVRVSASDRAWLVEGALDVRADATGWSDNAVMDVSAASLTSLTITHLDGETVTLYRERPDDRKLTLKNVPAGMKVTQQHQIDYMSGLLRDMAFNSARSVDAMYESTRPVFEVVAQTKEHLVVTLSVQKIANDGTAWARVQAKAQAKAQVEVQARTTDDAQVTAEAKKVAARITSRFDGWTLNFPRTVVDKLKIRTNDIVGRSTERESSTTN